MALPFWSPLIPMQGIAAIKSFLQKYGYGVKTIDLAVDGELLDDYQHYFDVIKKIVPEEKRGNFYNIGHDVLRNHMMAHVNYFNSSVMGNSVDESNPERYHELVDMIIFNTYHCHAETEHIRELNRVLDRFYNVLEQKFLKIVDEEKPAILGLSVNSGNLPASRFVFELTRKHNPSIQTIMGGSIFFNHLAVGNPDLDLFLEKTKTYIDKVIIGKGEILFLKLLRGEFPETKRLLTQDDVTDEETEIYQTEIPDLSDYNLEHYFYLAAGGSSSCPNKCSFCNVGNFFGKFKKKSAAQTVREMADLSRRYGHRLFFMTDSLLNYVITDVAAENIRAGVCVYMDGYFIADDAAADIGNTILWRRGGFYRARLGVESGSQRVLDMIGKHITPAQIKAAVSGLAFAGIKTTTYWVIGHPGETEDDFQQTLDLVEELKDEIWQAECNPFTYYYIGQSKTNEWADKRKLVYPEHFSDALMSRTWALDLEPSYEEIYSRVSRFARHCNKLGIPNPYSADEIYKADERWKRLHKHAVPSIIDIINNQCEPDESRKIKPVIAVQDKKKDDGDFGF